MASPKSATFADSGWLPASSHTSQLLLNWSQGLLLLLPGEGLAASSTLPALRSPCLQPAQPKWASGSVETRKTAQLRMCLQFFLSFFLRSA
jgi:hypothetical protein